MIGSYDIDCSGLPDHITQQDPTITKWRQLKSRINDPIKAQSVIGKSFIG